MLWVVAAWSIAFFFTSLFQCHPITPIITDARDKQVPWYSSKCIISQNLWNAGVISDVILDSIIIIMPVPMVLRLQLSIKDQIGVIAMFLTGIL